MTVTELCNILFYFGFSSQKLKMGLQDFHHQKRRPICSGPLRLRETHTDEKKPYPFDSDTVFFTSPDVLKHPENEY